MTRRFPEALPPPVALEEEILRRWQEEDTFRRSLEATRNGRPFVFYEGPPTANGRPGIHHVLARAIKDAVARFRTMQGRYVPRIAGWDTHGLPVEIEAEKELGLSGKSDIEAYGIDRFNAVCRASVLRYKEEWERFSTRIGYWLDYDHPYITFEPRYIESVWWALGQIADRGFLYRAPKVVPYCPRCGTPLSSHELALGYRDVADPSLYVLFPLLDDSGAPTDEALLVWTTTPWTLVANVAVALRPEFLYAVVRWQGWRLVVVRDRVDALFGADADVLATAPGSAWVGRRYQRPFEWLPLPDDPPGARDRACRVYPADFVGAEEGTGLVHIAPAFGADDYALGQAHGLPMLQPVDDRGCFRPEVPEVGGLFVKDADDRLVEWLRATGRVFRAGREVHSYPHCWRCRSPLLYMARESWFLRTTAVRQQLLDNNRQIDWHPPEIGEGRFGEWLANNVDWAISRNRYWGTPLPFWVCDANPDHVEVLGSFAELADRVGPLPPDFDPHRPAIDRFTWPCRHGDGVMRRTPEVLDVWFDSGAMPYAQWHYPFEHRDDFARHFPADFIAEGVDQTRGWFYSLLAISTLLGLGPAYRAVVVNDLVLDPEGQKMSKSRGNVVDPWEALATFGADAIRWYLLSVSQPWVPKRFDPDGVEDVQRRFFDTLRHTYRFLALYANLENWSPERPTPPPETRPLLDRWLRSRLHSTLADLTAEFERYELTAAARRLADFVVDELSNWYVRRSRDRFWNADGPEGAAAFATLYEALVAVARMMAPLAPFHGDWLHRALTGASVHLASWPCVDEAARDARLEERMAVARALVGLGRAAREQAGVRVRQPLPALYVTGPGVADLPAEILGIIAEELNVRRVEPVADDRRWARWAARPNFRALGARFGRLTPAVAAAIRALTDETLRAFRAGATVELEVDGQRIPLEESFLELVQEPYGELIVASDGRWAVALDPTITPELRAEGLARELVNRVQRLRKDAGLDVADRIRLGIGAPPELAEALVAHRDFIARETLALDLVVGPPPLVGEYAAVREVDLDGVRAQIGLQRVSHSSR